MFVQPSDARIAKQYAAAAIRLQPVFVRIDHNGVCISHSLERVPSLLSQILCQNEVTSVRGVAVYSKSILLPQRKNLG